MVSSRAEAERLEAGQDDHDYLDTATMLLVLPDRVVRVKPKVED
ncbi:L-Proline/Glycine betaine transporter ProP [Gulosibacter sp. 10]|nr:L-Proline/Glycine betaine transporter ProP [Gulosibacter sp. 10]